MNNKEKNIRARVRINKTALSFILPSLAIIIPLMILPTMYLFRLAFSNYNISKNAPPVFNGIQNFINLFTDQDFIISVKNTIIICLTAVIIEFVLGFILALLMNKRLKGERFFTTLFIIPMMIPSIVNGLNFRLILDLFGPINYIITRLGFSKVDFAASVIPAKVSIILTDVWQWTPFVFLILLAGLRSISKELFEAANVDGASNVNTFLFITWPMMAPTIALVLTFRVVDALKLYDIVTMLTYGGPAGTTQTLSLYIYRLGFRFGKLGYASSAAFIMLIFLGLLSFLILKAIKIDERVGWGKQ
ncbi:MAG: sugar ABC transporter permease [Actinobacteria bacterium]|nr:sugar ABC transporter permease [Actinomycetota bacterium]